MKYSNPVIRGFSPDPSICRVGEEYYLVNSSFEYFPGIPIYHSKDLINWEQIGNCISWNNPLSLRGVPNSGGIWAPTIRYVDGVFYVTAAIENYGNFIVSATNPAGDWSDPVWVDIGGIDPSMFFEEGNCYYCTTDRLGGEEEAISLAKIDPGSGKILEPFRIIWKGTGGGCLESPHVYHIGDWYYILTAEGGTFFGHMITIGRSRCIWGPYEGCPQNPILTNREDITWQVLCTGHGDILEDANGNWWMLHLAIRMARRTMSHLGRETFLTPFHWEEDWPVFGNRRAARLIEEGPVSGIQNCHDTWKDDFTDPDWDCRWRFLRNPELSCYERGNGVLSLRPSLGSLGVAEVPTFVGLRQVDFDSELSVTISFDPVEDGEEAGIVIYHTHEFYYTFGIRRRNGQRMLFMEKHAEDFHEITYEEENTDTAVSLVVKANKLFFEFWMSEGEHEQRKICQASTRYLANEVIGRSFTGTVWGLYAVAEKEAKTVASFHNFVYQY